MFYFQNCGEPVYLMASTDLMPRNRDRRVESAFLVLDPGFKTRLKQFLETQLADDVKGCWI